MANKEQAGKLSFMFSDTEEPHRERTRQILKKHPEVKQYLVKNPYTFLIILFTVSLQVTISWFLKDQPWWLMLIVAYTVGAIANHSLFVMIHECSHNSLFKNKPLNTISGIIANLPHVVPSSVSFAKYHMKHHAFQGVIELDADLADAWEARLIGNTFIGKAFWLLMFPVFQITRTFRLKEINLLDPWTFVNWIIQALFDVAIFYFFGPMALLYLLSSLFFAIGLHPLGARWIQEHYLIKPPQETYSYYGPLNTLAMNVGYHNEHHDFPSIPWNKLPKVKKTAPEFYDTLHYHTSWFKLWLKFLFDKNLSLFSRMTRSNRGAVGFNDEVKPDVDFAAIRK